MKEDGDYKIYSNSQYKRRFRGSKTKDTKTIEAFNFALDTRKFEIELYWKRTAYFWTFITVVFTGFGFLQWSKDLKNPSDLNQFVQFLLACFGFLLSFSWYFTNRGSKQWQENWEHHVDHLENHITGPLYKVVLKRVLPWNAEYEGSCCKKLYSQTMGLIDFAISGPSAHSVSKINQIISLYVTLLWAILLWYTINGNGQFEWDIYKKLILGTTIFTAFYILVFARTHFGSHHHYAYVRKSKLVRKSN